MSLRCDQLEVLFEGEIQQDAGVTDFDSSIERDPVFVFTTAPPRIASETTVLLERYLRLLDHLVRGSTPVHICGGRRGQLQDADLWLRSILRSARCCSFHARCVFNC